MSVTDRDAPPDWSQSRTPAGSFESVQRVELPAPVVEHSTAGARRLGDVYWDELQRSLHGLVRARKGSGGVELRVLGVGPPLLRFGRPEHLVIPDSVTCRYPILGGLLTRMPTGTLSAIDGFFPRLAPRRLRRRGKGVLYAQLQARLHVALNRRYFARLQEEAAR